MNEVEKPQVPPQPRTTAAPAPKPKPSAPKKPASNPTASRTPSSNAPSSTYFGTNNRTKYLHFNNLINDLLTFSFLPQLRTSSARRGCGTNVEGQPATGRTSRLKVLVSLRPLTLDTSSCLCVCRYKCPADCMNKKGKVWGTLFYDVVSQAAIYSW